MIEMQDKKTNYKLEESLANNNDKIKNALEKVKIDQNEMMAFA